MIRVLASVFLGLALVLSAKGQVFPHNTMFNYNRFAYNPAVAGSAEGTALTLLSRQQWRGMPRGPQWYDLTVHRPVQKLGGGVGVMLMGDMIGPYTVATGNLAYAANLKFGDGRYCLNFGINGGLKQANINADLVYSDVLDPLLPGSTGTSVQLQSSSKMMPSLGAGLHFAIKDSAYGLARERFFVGISGQDLTEPVMRGIFSDGSNYKINRTFFAYAGYRLDLSESASVTPMAFFRTDLTPGLNGLPFQLDLGATFNLQPVVLAASYRWQDAITATVGADISTNLFIGYAYDYTLSNINVGGFVQSHELILNYVFPQKGRSVKPIIDPYNQ